MSNNKSFSGKLISALIIAIVASISIFSCKDKPVIKIPDVLSKMTVGMDNSHPWQSYNVLFAEGTNSQQRNAGVYLIEESIRKYIRTFNILYDAEFHVFYCPCDSLLYNIGVKPIDGSGESISLPTPPKPPIPPSGDVLYLSNNISMDNSDTTGFQHTLDRVQLKNFSPDPSSPILAIIDTGIDTTLFSPNIRKLIWQPQTGVQPMFNFVGPVLWDFRDDYPGKHGTAVTALALHGMENLNSRPRLMILKALDKEKRGTIFTVSCALSYAIKNHATAINASLGYYGSAKAADPVFKHYLELCNNVTPAPIVVFAAAGNAPSPHSQSLLCNEPPTSGRLTSSRLFYPACFSTTLSNIISVTGLSSERNTSCRYQNYSKEYVSIGVLNDTANCCRYIVPFLSSGYEGSSFATPVACGKVMDCFITSGPGANMQTCITANSQLDPGFSIAIKEGRFMTYDGKRGW